jgi:hypothetical protein
VNQPATHPWRVLLPVWALALLAPALPLEAARPPAPRPAAVAHDAAGDSLTASASAAFARSPLAFEPNVGQTDAAVDFLTRRPGYALFLTSREAVFAFDGEDDAAVLRVRLDGARDGAPAAGEGPLPGRVNYLIGRDPAGWHVGVPTWGRVRYAGVYPGVDLVWYGNGAELEYDFVVAPGADPGAIRLAFDGASRAALAANGDLLLEVAGRQVRQTRPVIWQETAAGRREVEGGYVLDGGAAVRFDVGAYDRALPLVIDPVLVYGTFLGGSATDAVNDIVLDGDGNLYATGETASSSFPTAGGLTSGPGSPNAAHGSRDVFVTKLNPGGTALVYSTYVGGIGFDRGLGVALDSNGRAWVTGFTRSTDFPVVDAFQATLGGGNQDGFVLTLSADGTALLLSSFVGGEQDSDVGNAVAVDGNGDAYVVGLMRSDTLGFTPPAGGLQPTRTGGTDGFVLKVNDDNSLAYFTYLGGGVADQAFDVAVDGDGNAYVTGVTSSSTFLSANGDASFATFDAVGSGTSDAFVVKLGPAGDDLIHGSFVGGDADEDGNGIALDGDGNAYLTGSTTSSNFPTAGTPFQTVQGSLDAFVSRVNAAGDALVFSTYLGGTADDVGMEIAVDACDRPFVAGFTNSGAAVDPADDFPTLEPLHGYGGGNDAFLTGLTADGSALVFSTFIGGVNNDVGNAVVATTCGGDVYAGGVAGNAFPDVVNGSFDTSYGGGTSDGFVLRIALEEDPDTDDDGIPNDVEPTNQPPTDPNVKDNDIFTADSAGNRLFAMQQFRDFVEREGLEGGIGFWANALTNATATRAEVVRFFYNSSEYQNEYANVIRLALGHRQGFASQIPDAGTLQELYDAFQAGADLFDLSATLAADAEWVTRYGTGAFADDPAGNDAFVTQVFNDLLGRAPAQAGLDYWSNQLDADDITRPDLFAFITETNEFKNRIANEQFVVSIFLEMLLRAPAQGGFTFWVNQLDGGGSNLALINAILGSAEYEDRFLP